MESKLQLTAHNAWARFCKLYPKLVFGAMPSVKFNNRLKTTAGWCLYEKREIQICRELFEEHTLEMCRVVIPHELAHQVCFDLHKKHGHCPEWKQIMITYGLPPDRCHNMINTRHSARRAGMKL